MPGLLTATNNAFIAIFYLRSAYCNIFNNTSYIYTLYMYTYTKVIALLQLHEKLTKLGTKFVKVSL